MYILRTDYEAGSHVVIATWSATIYWRRWMLNLPHITTMSVLNDVTVHW